MPPAVARGEARAMLHGLDSFRQIIGLGSFRGRKGDVGLTLSWFWRGGVVLALPVRKRGIGSLRERESRRILGHLQDREAWACPLSKDGREGVGVVLLLGMVVRPWLQYGAREDAFGSFWEGRQGRGENR